MNNYRAMFLVMLACIGLAMTNIGGCSDGLTPEQLLERRVADLSAAPYIEEGRKEAAEVLNVLEDIPNSPLVRVVVRRFSDRFVLTALATKCSKLRVGQPVQVVYFSYHQTEFEMGGAFYIEEE